MTPCDIAVAREFRRVRRAELARLHEAGPDLTVSVLVRYERHDCAAKGGRSVFLELREHYAYSPAYHYCDCGQVCRPAAAHLVECDRCGPVPLTDGKRFGWIWTQGRCPSCGLTALSRTGRLVDPAERPPAEHAIIS